MVFKENQRQLACFIFLNEIQRKTKKGVIAVQGFTTTVQLPDELSAAIKAAVQKSFVAAQKSMTADAQLPLYMNTKQTCEYLNVSYNTLKSWLRTNPDFPRSVVNGVTRFNRNDVTEFMRKCK